MADKISINGLSMGPLKEKPTTTVKNQDRVETTQGSVPGKSRGHA